MVRKPNPAMLVGLLSLVSHAAAQPWIVVNGGKFCDGGEPLFGRGLEWRVPAVTTGAGDLLYLVNSATLGQVMIRIVDGAVPTWEVWTGGSIWSNAADALPAAVSGGDGWTDDTALFAHPGDADGFFGFQARGTASGANYWWDNHSYPIHFAMRNGEVVRWAASGLYEPYRVHSLILQRYDSGQ